MKDSDKGFRSVSVKDCTEMAPLKCLGCEEVVVLPVGLGDDLMPGCERCGGRDYREVGIFAVRVAKVQRRWAEFEVFGDFDGRGVAPAAFIKALAAEDDRFSSPSPGSYEIESQERLNARIYLVDEISGAMIWFREHEEYPFRATDKLTGKEISLFKRIFIDDKRLISGDFWRCKCERGGVRPLNLEICPVCGGTRKEGDFPTIEETLIEMMGGFLRPIKSR